MAVSGLGKRLRNYRTAMGLTQAQLGKTLGVSQVTIANYEREERFPRHRTLLALADVFDVSLDTLLDTPNPVDLEVAAGEQNFDVDELIRKLLDEPTEVSLAYTSRWMISRGLDLATFYESVLITVLRKTGELWSTGDLLVSEEHLVSDKVRELALVHANREWERNPVTPEKDKRWIGFCAPGERHDMALLMYSQLLRLAGWTTWFLGIQVPSSDLFGIIRKRRPTVLGISVSLAKNLGEADAITRRIREEFGETPAIILGGRGVESVSSADLSAVDAITTSLSKGVRLAEDLISPAS